MKRHTRIGSWFAALVAAVVVALSGCGQPIDLSVLLDGETGVPLAISPQNENLFFGESATFGATGGTPPYSFGVDGDGTIDAETGAYTAPTSAKSESVHVTDADGTVARATVEVFPPSGYAGMAVTPSVASVLTTGTVTFTTSGGVPPYVFRVSSGESGSITLEPTVSDSSSVDYTAGDTAGKDTIEVRDSSDPQQTILVEVTVSQPGTEIDYEPTTVAHGSGLTGGQAVTGQFEYQNSGTSDGTATVTWTAYVSKDQLPSVDDTILQSGDVSGLAAGETSAAVAFSGTLPPVEGDYYLLVTLTSSEDWQLANNVGVSPRISISGSPPPDVDYHLFTLTSPSTSPGVGSAIEETFTVENQGTAAGTQKVHWTAYLSGDSSLSLDDTLVSSGSLAQLEAGAQSSPVPITGTWPAGSGDFHLIVQLSAGDDVEATNDTGATPAVTVTPADVRYNPSVTVVDATPTVETEIPETFSIANVGADDGTYPVYWTVYRSLSDDVLDSADTVVDTGQIAALSGSSTSGVIDIDGTWPNSASATYHLIVELSWINDGTSHTATGATSAFELQAPDVNYAVGGPISSPGASGTGGATFSGQFVLQNVGSDPGAELVIWTAYVSSDEVFDGVGEVMVDSAAISALAAGADQTVTYEGTWPTSPGDYYVHVEVSANDDQDPLDNVGSTTTTTAVTGIASNVDYDVDNVTHSAGLTGGGAFSGSFSFSNVGSGAGSADVGWTVYVSADDVLGGGDTAIDSGSVSSPAAGASSGDIAFTGTWPESDGDYYLIAAVSSDEDGNIGNNTQPGGVLTVSGSPPPQIDYIVTGIESAGGTPDAGSSFSETFAIENQLAESGSATVYWAAYLSATDATIDPLSDDVLATGEIAALAGTATSTNISISGAWPADPGTDYYLLVRVSASDDVDTTNNVSASGVFQLQYPDVNYSVTGPLTSPGATAVGGDAFSEQFEIVNGGTDAGSEQVFWTVYVSTDAALGGDTTVDFGSISALATGSGQTVSYTGTWPTSPGHYYVIAEVTAADDVDTSDDWVATSTSTEVTGVASDVDYALDTLDNTGTLTGGGPLTGTFEFSNVGTTDGSETIAWKIYVSDDQTLGGGDTEVASDHESPLVAGNSSGSVSFSGTWPSQDADYYLLASLSANEDGNIVNNTGWAGPFTVAGSPAPDVDYSVASVSASGTPATAGTAMSGSLTIENLGTDSGSKSVLWSVYSSYGDTTLDSGDTLLDAGQIDGLAASSTSDTVAIGGNWPEQPGNPYYLIVEVESTDDVDPSNNVQAGSAFELTAPDVNYAVGSISSPSASVAPGEAVSESFTYSNNGVDAGSASVYWYAYVSTKSSLDGSTEVPLDSGVASALTGATTSPQVSIGGTWPTTSGTYYLILKLSAGDDVDSTDNADSAGPLDVAPTGSVDYVVSSVTSQYTLVTTGSLLSEKFTVKNIGDTAGAETIFWDAYASSDAVWDAGDQLVSSGELPALAAGDSHSNVFIGSTWPPAEGHFYLIVSVTAADDAEVANDLRSSTSSIEVYAPPDYVIALPQTDAEVEPGVTYEAWDAGGHFGELLSQTIVRTQAPVVSASTHYFEIVEITGNAGNTLVEWEIVFSTDQVFGGDIYIDGGTLPAFAGNQRHRVDFDPPLPSTAEDYYILISVDSSDDRSASNNTRIAGPIHVFSPNAVDNLETDTVDETALDARDYNFFLNDGDIAEVQGTMDLVQSTPPAQTAEGKDYYLVTLGDYAVSLVVSARWTDPAADAIDLAVFDPTGLSIGSSISEGTTSEPDTLGGEFLVDVTGLEFVYVLVDFYADNPGGQSYTLTLEVR